MLICLSIFILGIAVSCSYSCGWRLVQWFSCSCPLIWAQMHLWFSYDHLVFRYFALFFLPFYFFLTPFCVEQLSAFPVCSGKLMKLVIRPLSFILGYPGISFLLFLQSFLRCEWAGFCLVFRWELNSTVTAKDSSHSFWVPGELREESSPQRDPAGAWKEEFFFISFSRQNDADLPIYIFFPSLRLQGTTAQCPVWTIAPFPSGEAGKRRVVLCALICLALAVSACRLFVT